MVLRETRVRVPKEEETLNYQMASVLKHKKARTTPESQGQDRLSKLPDELIHKIYSFLDAKEAVQASVLSKRWKLMWTTLPSIAFSRYSDCLSNLPFCNVSRFAMFIRHVLCNRNHHSSVSELKMYVPWKLTVERSVFSGCVIEKFIQYAIEREVECLNIGLGYRCEAYKLSAFSSKSLRELTLNMPLEMCEESDCWDLPALTTLHLKHNLMLCLYLEINHKITESWLTSLPALRTLQLDLWNLSETSFSLPNLTTLGLYHCALSKTVWDLPALINLHLDIGALPKNLSDIFSTLASLKNLTLILDTYIEQDHFISCPQLLNLNIRISCHPSHDTPHGKIMVRAPQLCNFSSFGIFSITFEVTELEDVDIQLKDYFRYVGCVDRKTYYQRFTCMLLGLGTAKNISFDLESIEALAKNCNLASCASPFYNLKCVKLPKEYKVSSIPGALRSYLLSGSPGATIVTSFPRVCNESNIFLREVNEFCAHIAFI